MGRLIVSAQMTVDSVMDQVEGWFDGEAESELHGMEELRAANALVLGRETYQHFSTYWPTQDNEYARLINPMPTWVASRTLSSPLSWNAELLPADLDKAVQQLKAEHAGTLLSYGCGALAGRLAHAGLIDEVRLWIHPTVWGDGVRPFHAGALPLRMRLIAATPYSSGVVKLAYQPLSE